MNVNNNPEKDEEIIFCKRCGRKLLGEHSKELGFGPTCYKAWKKERSQQIQLFDIGDSDGE